MYTATESDPTLLLRVIGAMFAEKSKERENPPRAGGAGTLGQCISRLHREILHEFGRGPIAGLQH